MGLKLPVESSGGFFPLSLAFLLLLLLLLAIFLVGQMLVRPKGRDALVLSALGYITF